MNTTANHTPGPWELVSLSGYGSPFSIRMAYIAETAKKDQTHYGVQSVRRREDAQLIAAAPDLLEALKGLLADIEEYQRINLLGGENNHWQIISRSAIAKAEGGAE